MIDPMHLNRKLLVSVYNAQEAREAILGGGRIIDCENPKTALGNISPRDIMAIGDAVLAFKRGLDVQLSTNIGEDQLLFRRDAAGMAVEKSPDEIAGKAAQAAIGVAISMGNHVHPSAIVKVGLDGMRSEEIETVLTEIVLTLKRTGALRHTRVMSVLFAQDLDLWAKRKSNDDVRRSLVLSREYSSCEPDASDAFDISPHVVRSIRAPTIAGVPGGYVFNDQAEVTLDALKNAGLLPADAKAPFVRLNDLYPHSLYFPEIAKGTSRTSRNVIAAMVDATARAGADGIMIDTSILSKAANICCVDTTGSDMVDINSLVKRAGLEQRGILKLDDIRFFTNYCHYRGLVANLAGSIDSYQAQQLWCLVPDLDEISTRGAASALARDPRGLVESGGGSRSEKVIVRSLVRGLAPPECGGVLNLPARLHEAKAGAKRIKLLVERLGDWRRALGQSPLQAFLTDDLGTSTPLPQSK